MRSAPHGVLVLLISLCAVAILPGVSAATITPLKDAATGRVFAIRVTPDPSVASGGPGTPTAAFLGEAATAFLMAHRDLIGIEDPARDLVARSPEIDKLGYSRVCYQQQHHGLDVLTGEVQVHFNRGGQIYYVKTKVARDLPLETTPIIPETAARGAALRAAASEFNGELSIVRSRLVVLPLGVIDNRVADDPLLVWEIFALDSDTDGMRYGERLWFEARSGNLLRRIPTAQKLFIQVVDCASETGMTLRLNGHGWTSACMNILPMGCGAEVDLESPAYPPYVFGRAQDRPVRGPYPVPNQIYFGRSDVDSGYTLIEDVHNYYRNHFGINGANGQGGTATGVVASGITRLAAHADSPSCTSGLCPNGGMFNTPTGTIAICVGSMVGDLFGHEYFHAVAYHSFPPGSGGPLYSGQCGSLNEGSADLMGQLIEFHRTGQTDWKQSTAPSYPPLRDLANPEFIVNASTGLPYPDRFYSPNYYCGSGDQYGVHWNSTVFSHALYLMSEGGEFNGCTIPALGRSVVEQILFRGWRTYFSQSVSFNEAYADMIQAADDLYGPVVAAGVRTALQAAEMDQPGFCSGIPAQIPICAQATAIPDESASPADGSSIRFCGPNPAFGPATIEYALARAGDVTVTVYDAAGRLVDTVASEWQDRGIHQATWTGRRVASGLYFVRVAIGGQTIGIGRLIIVR